MFSLWHHHSLQLHIATLFTVLIVIACGVIAWSNHVQGRKVVLGAALVVAGLFTLGRRQRTLRRRPRWIEGIGSFGPLPAFGIGLALNVRPKSLLLFAAGSLAIAGAHVNTDDTLVAIAVYTAIATSTVVVPTVATVLFPHRMEPWLVAARDWITAQGAALTGVVMVGVGVVVLVAGVR